MKIPKPILERRLSIRIQESLPFHIGHDDYELEASTINISSNGAMCSIEKSIPLMTQLNIGLTLPPFGKNRQSRQLRLKGVVVRREPDPAGNRFLIAIFFSDAREADKKLLLEFIEHRLQSHP